MPRRPNVATKAAPAVMRETPAIFDADSIRGILAGQKTQTRRLRGLGKDLKVRLPYEVRSDLADLMPSTKIVAPPGVYWAEIHGGGAVTIRVNGTSLGVKPGEFDFVCPFAEGTTRLVDHVWRIEPHGSQRLWVKETWRPLSGPDRCLKCGARKPKTYCIGGCKEYRPDVAYRATNAPLLDVCPWRSPLFMPRWASRLTLEVTGVRLERLQSITCSDIRAEGVGCPEHDFGSGFCTSECAARRAAFASRWDELNGKKSPWTNSPWCWAIEFRRIDGR